MFEERPIYISEKRKNDSFEFEVKAIFIERIPKIIVNKDIKGKLSPNSICKYWLSVKIAYLLTITGIFTVR